MEKPSLCLAWLNAGYPAFHSDTQPECRLPILWTSKTHGARKQDTERAETARWIRRIAPRPEYRITDLHC